MFCIFCGKEIVHKSKFCIYCGKQLPVREIQQIHESLEIQNENFETEENHTCEQHAVNSSDPFGLKSKDNTDVKKEQEVDPQSIVPSIPMESPEKSVKICKSCGSENPGEMTFCGRCGTNMYKQDGMSRGSNQGFYQSWSMQYGNQPSNGASHPHIPYPGQDVLHREEMKRLASMNGSVGIESSAYLLKVNPMYPVYVPKTKEEKIAVIALDMQNNWNRAIKEKYFTASGRASRGEYWKVQLYQFFLWIGMCIFLLILGASIAESSRYSSGVEALILSGGIVTLLFIIGNVLLIIPSWMITIRRFHDIGKSGWWILLTCIPYIGAIIQLYFMCQRGDAHINEYGKPENYYDPTLEECKELGLVQNSR
ncbi:DUF805 domain-containing protein [Veillonella sp. CHU740]|uniref:DUF805 domain-containing protein n=1 Tax=Veillonella sp. CHU740 TaxID=2490950 RepID=UPI000F8DC65B|nr:DUF805 domain-containing protein [Veillonella sp. CHU740]